MYKYMYTQCVGMCCHAHAPEEAIVVAMAPAVLQGACATHVCVCTPCCTFTRRCLKCGGKTYWKHGLCKTSACEQALVAVEHQFPEFLRLQA